MTQPPGSATDSGGLECDAISPGTTTRYSVRAVYNIVKLLKFAQNCILG